MMNRSAKDGARLSRHYGGESVLTHPSHHGVCERHGTEDLDVTPGGLVAFPAGAAITEPISREVKWERTRREGRRFVEEAVFVKDYEAEENRWFVQHVEPETRTPAQHPPSSQTSTEA